MIISGLEWDDYNDREIARHQVTPEEVEDICYGLHISKRDPDFKSKGKERYILAGKTPGGRYLDVIIEKLHGSYYRPVTAFEMSENYKRSFQRRVEKRGSKWKK
jgi:uncharacterized DUF497 family protein